MYLILFCFYLLFVSKCLYQLWWFRAAQPMQVDSSASGVSPEKAPSSIAGGDDGAADMDVDNENDAEDESSGDSAPNDDNSDPSDVFYFNL